MALLHCTHTSHPRRRGCIAQRHAATRDVAELPGVVQPRRLDPYFAAIYDGRSWRGARRLPADDEREGLLRGRGKLAVRLVLR